VEQPSIDDALKSHLAWWGLKRFTSDADYFAWQRQQLSSAALYQLNAQVERKREGDRRDEIAFYDLTAQPQILPVLYSQRYEYYESIGSRVAARLGDATSILDFGCGVGILTTFYARQFPEKQIIGIDRSSASVAVARQKAEALGLANVRFACLDVETDPLVGSYDLIIATHALVQAEQDPGIPSRNWRTFERSHDVNQQAAFEQRTGIGLRLDRLTAILVNHGRIIVFEKTRALARRIPFQRALAARGLQLVEQPELIRYRVVEEVADDGPFYEVQKGRSLSVDWDETPEPDRGLPFDPATLSPTASNSDDPLYENHHPSAQQVWQRLHDRSIVKEQTKTEPDGRQMHVELGTTEGYSYLYCANTFDQRQVVIVDQPRTAMIETYYQEIAGGNG
jgi:SAM-dependent methyltransferase